MSHETFETLAAVYAVGALDGDDLPEFEAHLRTCPACQAAVRDAEEALARAALTAPPQAPPAAAREALVRRIGERRGVRSRAWLRWAGATLVAAAAAAVFASTWVAVRYEARLGQMARETAAIKQRVVRDEAALRQELDLYRDVVELLRDPTTRVVDLRGRDGAVSASGRVLWNQAAGGHLLVNGLSPAPAGRTYALWAISADTPRAVGMFAVDEHGRGEHRITPDAARGEVRAFAVTVEPETGTPAPTGPIVLTSSR
jgi:anti-sigma-K factor RskA